MSTFPPRSRFKYFLVTRIKRVNTFLFTAWYFGVVKLLNQRQWRGRIVLQRRAPTKVSFAFFFLPSPSLCAELVLLNAHSCMPRRSCVGLGFQLTARVKRVVLFVASLGCRNVRRCAGAYSAAAGSVNLPSVGGMLARDRSSRRSRASRASLCMQLGGSHADLIVSHASAFRSLKMQKKTSTTGKLSEKH